MKGKEVKVPEGYKGFIVKKSGEKHEQKVAKQQAEDEEEDEFDEDQVETISAIGSFDEITLWGHDTGVPEDDSFVKGIGEWISFAETVGIEMFTEEIDC